MLQLWKLEKKEHSGQPKIVSEIDTHREKVRNTQREVKTRRDGMKSRGHGKTQRGACKWEPENRNTHM